MLKCFTRMYLRRLFLNIQWKIMCRLFLKDVNASFKMCVMVPNTYMCPRIAYPCENMFFPQNQRPEGLAECLLTGLSFLEAWLNPLDHGKFPVLQKLKFLVTGVCFIIITTRYHLFSINNMWQYKRTLCIKLCYRDSWITPPVWWI